MRQLVRSPDPEPSTTCLSLSLSLMPTMAVMDQSQRSAMPSAPKAVLVPRTRCSAGHGRPRGPHRLSDANRPFKGATRIVLVFDSLVGKLGDRDEVRKVPKRERRGGMQGGEKSLSL